MANITKLLVENARPRREGQLFVRDDQLTGFALRVTCNGVKSFVWEGRIKGRMRRITLGQFPALSVLDARKAALETKTAIVHGADPSKERADQRAEATFGELANTYLERHARQRKVSWREDEALLNNHVPLSWRSRRLSEISRQDVIHLRDAVSRKTDPRKKGNAKAGGIPYAANHLIRLLRAMFNLARDWGMISADNPATRIKLFPERKRDRFLSPDELARVNQALAQEPNESWRAYFALSLMLGTRKSELLATRWTDLEFKQRTLRIPRTKAGRPHLLPLPTPAISILESLPSRNASEWVFPSAASATGHMVSPKPAWARIRRAAGVPDVQIHDLRRTLGSWLAASGYSLPLIGRALNHSNVSTTAIYARLDLDPVRTALENNAAMMLSAGADTKIQTEEVAASVAKGDPDPIGSTAFLRTVPPETSVLTREALYQRVWSNPVESVAQQLGISGRGLSKICLRFEIPVPPRGYWAKLAAGKRQPKIPLARATPNLSPEIRIRTTRKNSGTRVEPGRMGETLVSL